MANSELGRSNRCGGRTRVTTEGRHGNPGMTKAAGYTIQPYNMNGLNWRVVSRDSLRHNIIVATGFMPSWWEAEYGMTFGKEFHVDAAVHCDTLARMECILGERFGDLPDFFCGDDYKNSWAMERRYGDGLMLAILGGHVSFDDASGHPHPDVMNLSDEQSAALSVPNVEDSPVLRSLLDDWPDPSARRTGELGFEGLVNNVFYLRGEEMFIDLAEKPELFRHACEVVWETTTRVVHRFRRWQDPSARTPTHYVNADCLLSMLSEKPYREHLLEFEHRFSERFDIYGVHTCNWNADRYLDALSGIQRLDYLDMGEETNLDRVHKLFPDLGPTVFLHPERVKSLAPKALKREVTELCKKLVRGYILLADLAAGTDDARIRMIHDVAAAF